MLKKKKGNKIARLLSLLMFTLSIVFIFLLMRLHILPDKYFYPITITIGIVNLIMFIALRFSRRNIFKLVSLVLSIGLGYGVFCLFNTSNILTNMNINYKTSNYVIIVRNDSSYEKINDLEDKNIGYFVEDKKVLKKVRIDFNPVEYDDITNLALAVLDNKVDAIMMEQSYVDMLNESTSSIPNFKDKIRIIYSFKMNSKITDITRDVNTTKESFIIYLSGIDTYGTVESVSRTDANMLMVVNPNTHQILLVSIPRDYYIELYEKNAKDKLTHSGIYGIDNTVKSVEKLLDIDINYYYKINFTSLINIVDSIKGVDVYSNYSFTSKDGYNYTKGYNHVNGKEALSFVRERKAFNGGDRVRNANQQAMVEALFRKCTDSSILTSYNSLLSSLKNSFITNMPQKSLTSLIKKQLDDKIKWNITSYNLDGTNSREYTYSYKANKLYVMIPNDKTVNEAKDLIKEVMSGKKLESSYKNEVTDIKNVTKSQNNKVDVNTKDDSKVSVSSNSNKAENSNEKNNKNVYVVTYSIDNKIEKIEVEEGNKAKVMPIPSKDGYEVLGWYLNDNIYDFNTKITSNITLVAKYQKIDDEEQIDLENDIMPEEMVETNN